MFAKETYRPGRPIDQVSRLRRGGTTVVPTDVSQVSRASMRRGQKGRMGRQLNASTVAPCRLGGRKVAGSNPVAPIIRYAGRSKGSQPCATGLFLRVSARSFGFGISAPCA